MKPYDNVQITDDTSSYYGDTGIVVSVTSQQSWAVVRFANGSKDTLFHKDDLTVLEK